MTGQTSTPDEEQQRELARAREELQARVEQLLGQLGRLQESSTTWSTRLEARGEHVAKMLKRLRELSRTLPEATPAALSEAQSTFEDATVCYQGFVNESRFWGWTASVVALSLVLWILGLAILILYNYLCLQGTGLLYTVIYCISGGSLGGAPAALKDFIYFSGKRLFDPAWAYSYVLRPLLGGVMGVVVYALVRGGLVVASQGKSAEATPDTTFYFALAFVGGFAVEQVARKLYDIADTAFAVSDRVSRGR